MSESRGPGIFSFLLTVLLVIALVVGGVWFYNKSHVVTAGDKVGKAIDAMPAVASKVADEVTDKGTIDKVGDAIKDTGQAASSALSKTGKAASSAASETSADVKAAKEKHEASADRQN